MILGNFVPKFIFRQGYGLFICVLTLCEIKLARPKALGALDAKFFKEIWRGK